MPHQYLSGIMEETIKIGHDEIPISEIEAIGIEGENEQHRQKFTFDYQAIAR